MRGSSQNVDFGFTGFDKGEAVYGGRTIPVTARENTDRGAMRQPESVLLDNYGRARKTEDVFALLFALSSFVDCKSTAKPDGCLIGGPAGNRTRI